MRTCLQSRIGLLKTGKGVGRSGRRQIASFLQSLSIANSKEERDLGFSLENNNDNI